MNPPNLRRAALGLAPCTLLALLAQQPHAQSRTTDAQQEPEQKVTTSPSDHTIGSPDDGHAPASDAADVPQVASRPLFAADAIPNPTVAPESVPAAIRGVSYGAPTDLMFDVDEDGAIWARGRGFKASFDGESATIVPFFGSEAPQNYPIEFRANMATLDGIALPSLAPTRAVRSGREVRIDRAVFVEEYELDEERLEQRFVFDSLPRRGELVVRIGVETELSVSDLGDTLRFSNELGHVDYGQAFAIDAAGARIVLERTYEDGAITLTVPSSFVTSASLPLTIDPFVTFFTVSSSGNQELFPDISYDATSDRWCAVWTDVFSTNDHDVFAKVMNSGGGNLGFLTIDFTSDYWTTPRIANNNDDNVFLVVAAVDPAPVTANRGIIRGRLVAPASVTTGAQFDISPSGATDRYLPDVGGDPFVGGASFFCVVWQHDVSASNVDVEMRIVDATGALVGGAVDLSNTPGRNERPAISSSIGSEQLGSGVRWTVAWEFEFSSADHDIYARRVEWNGVMLTPAFAVDTSALDEREPSASTMLDPIAGVRYSLIVYQRDLGTDQEDIYGALINGSTVITRRNLVGDFPPATAPYRQLSPKVDSDGRHFLIGHVEINPFVAYDPNVWISDYYVSDGALVPCTVRENFAGSPASESDLALHSQASSGGARKRYFGTWLFGATSYDIQGGLWDGCGGGAVTSYCFGDGSGISCPCGNDGTSGNGCASSVNPNGARLSGIGDASVVADTFLLQASGMPATASCLYFQGSSATSVGSVFGDGKRCTTGTVIRLGTKTNSAGASQYPTGADPSISVRGLVPAAGATRFYQAWYRNAAVFCTSATFNLTNGLQVVWAP